MYLCVFRMVAAFELPTVQGALTAQNCHLLNVSSPLVFIVFSITLWAFLVLIFLSK